MKFETISFETDKPPTRIESWELIGALPKYEQCLMMQKEMFEKQIKGWEEAGGFEVNSVPFGLISVKFPKGGLKFIKLNCFPDTIDPRK